MNLPITNRYTYFLILIGIFLISCKGVKNVEKVSLVQTDLQRYNLKGSVQKMDVTCERNYSDTLSEEKVLDIEFRNDYNVRDFPMGITVFDSTGFINEKVEIYENIIVSTVALKYRHGLQGTLVIDKKDYREKKKKFFGVRWQGYPVFNNNKVLINYNYTGANIFNEYPKPFTLYHNYNYNKNLAGQIVTVKEYLSGEPVISKEEMNIRRINGFDKNGLIKRQDLKLIENMKINRLLLTVMLHNMDVSINSKIHYLFDYDSLSRMTDAQLFENNRVIWSETYAYRDTSMRPYKLNRFIIAARTFAKHLTNNTSEWYNQYGDITKSVNYDIDGNVIRTRFYEYVYDKLNNWTQCRMYLMGGAEKTEKPTLVANREIEYFPTDKKIEN